MVDVWGKSLRDNHEVENQVIHFQLKLLNLSSQYEERLAKAEEKLAGNNLMDDFVKIVELPKKIKDIMAADEDIVSQIVTNQKSRLVKALSDVLKKTLPNELYEELLKNEKIVAKSVFDDKIKELTNKIPKKSEEKVLEQKAEAQVQQAMDKLFNKQFLEEKILQPISQLQKDHHKFNEQLREADVKKAMAAAGLPVEPWKPTKPSSANKPAAAPAAAAPPAVAAPAAAAPPAAAPAAAAVNPHGKGKSVRKFNASVGAAAGNKNKTSRAVKKRRIAAETE